MGAAADCELIGPGVLGQPVNTITTLAFVVAGAYLLRQRLRWVGIALIATGIGSFLFHGPMPAGSEWVHDVTLAWLILVIAGIGESWEKWSRLRGLAVVAALFGLVPVVADPVAAALTAFAVVLILRRDRSVATVGPLVLIGVVAIIGRLGATGNPLCDPDSLLQPHGLWHIGAAVGVVWWALSIDSADLPLHS